MMTRQRSAKAAKASVKPAEKPRQSPAKPAEVSWQARRKRHCNDKPSLRRQEQYLSLINDRINDLDTKIPASKAQFDDYLHSYKSAAFEIRVLKQRMRWARTDFNAMKQQAEDERRKFLTMVNDRALYRRIRKRKLGELDGAPVRTESLLLQPYLPPVEDECTDDDIPDDCDDVPVGPPPSPDDYYVPSTPDYEVA